MRYTINMLKMKSFTEYISKKLMEFDSPVSLFSNENEMMDKMNDNCRLWIESNFNNRYVKNFISSCKESDLDYLNNFCKDYLEKIENEYNSCYFEIIKTLIKYIFINLATICPTNLSNWFPENNYYKEINISKEDIFFCNDTPITPNTPAISNNNPINLDFN